MLEAARVAEGLRRVLLGSEPHFSMYYRCPSPEQMRWFLCVVSPLGTKRPGGALVTHLDVTEHLQRDGHLVRQLSILEATPSPMVILDADARFDWANHA